MFTRAEIDEHNRIEDGKLQERAAPYARELHHELHRCVVWIASVYKGSAPECMRAAERVLAKIDGEPRHGTLSLSERVAALPDLTDAVIAKEAEQLMRSEVCDQCGRNRVDTGTRCYCGAKWAEMVS